MTAARDLAGLGRRFEVALALRIAVLLAAGAALAWAINRPGLYATTLLAGLVTGAALAELWLFLRRTNLAVARFVVAQYLFQSELVALYNDAELTAIVPDLPARCRAEAA